MNFPLAAALVFAAAVHAQGPARWLADLGDATDSEAAEIALLAMGERAAPLLIDVLRETKGDAAAPRQRAALRVLALLGPDAAAVGGDLAGMEPGRALALDWLQARASLEPWANAQGNWFEHVGEWTDDRKLPDVLAAVWRMQGRQVPTGLDTAGLLERLAADEIFAREAVADLLGRTGDKSAVAPLCAALRARDRQPAHADALRHNGFVLPVQDRFRFAAAEAVLRLAPDDPRAAIAWSGRALLHPHRSVRLSALAALARHAPDIDDSVPDLLAIARGDDSGLAVEAVKLLGITRSGGAAAIGELELLAAGTGVVARRCKDLVARLHAAGVTAAPPPAPAVSLLVDPAKLARTAVADDAASLPSLLERLRKEHTDVPDAVVLAIGRIGSARPLAEREDLRGKLQGRYGDSWQTPAISTSRFGSRDVPGDADFRACADLTVGDETQAGPLADLLTDGDPFVRLVAAQRLASSSLAVSTLPSAAQAALVAAARAKHPRSVPMEKSPFHIAPPDVDLDARIHAAAAAALVACDLPADQRAEFLPLLRPGDDVEAIARGLRRWADARSLPALTDALGDERLAVAVAAAEAIGSLGKAAAPAAPALRKAVADARVAVAAAARAALQVVE